MTVRTLVVDDEQLARERLAQLLSAEPHIELVGQCGDGQEALTAIREKNPDLVFLDIQMPELDGFGVLEALEPEKTPVIVFVTAYNQFALRAFEVHAVDYLLKPYDRERFQAALRHAIDQVKQRAGGGQLQRQAALLKDLRQGKPVDRLAVKSGSRVVFVKVADIDWIEAAQNYVELHVQKQSYLLRETLNATEARLPADKFLRISRSVIVNIERVKELQPLFYGEYALTLQDGTRVTLSRRYRDKLPLLGLE